MYAGAAHADASEYRPCIHLWNYALGMSHYSAVYATLLKTNLLCDFTV